MKKDIVKLSSEDKEYVHNILNSADTSDITRKKANVLIMSDHNAGKPASAAEIAARCGVNEAFVNHTVGDFCLNGAEYVLSQKKTISISEADREREQRERKERLEILKLKQGLIEESEIIKEEIPYAKPELKGKAWWDNFFYHNKVTIFLVSFFVFIFIYMTYDFLNRERPDMTVLFCTTADYTMMAENIEKALERYCTDYNGDGKIHVEVIDITLDTVNVLNAEVFMANQTKLLTELAQGESPLMIIDDGVFDLVAGNVDYAIHDLTELYPGNPDITGYGYKLAGSGFAKAADWEMVSENVYVTLRTDFVGSGGRKSSVDAERAKALEVLNRIMANTPARAE